MKIKAHRTVITIETVQRMTIRSCRGTKIARSEQPENESATDLAAKVQGFLHSPQARDSDEVVRIETGGGDLPLVPNDSLATEVNNK